MSVRLPPWKVIIPSSAVYRAHMLPPELWETWVIVFGITWVNGYQFTPPVSHPELVALHKSTVLERALARRLKRLEELGWLTVQRVSGIKNVYRPVVPPDGPAVIRESDSDDTLPETAVPRGSPLGTEFPRCSVAGTEPNPSSSTPVVDDTGGNTNIVVVAVSNSLSDKNRKTKTTTTTANNDKNPRSDEEVFRIGDALADLDLVDPGARAEALALEYVTAEYVEDWVMHRRLTDEKLGAGYYRLQIRNGLQSQYHMSERQRAEYRHRKDEDWDMAAMREQAGEGNDDG